MIFEFTEALIDAVDGELGDECLMDCCDRDSVDVPHRYYCSKHFFAEQMIDRKLDDEVEA